MNDKVTFLGEQCNVEFARYENGRIAIKLVCESGEPMATATVNMPDVRLLEGEVIIKDYSENEGIYQALFDAGIVGISMRTANGIGTICTLNSTIQQILFPNRNPIRRSDLTI